MFGDVWQDVRGIGCEHHLVMDVMWLSVSISWLSNDCLVDGWLRNDGLVDGWLSDECLLDCDCWSVSNSVSFFVHNSVESVDWISCVVNNTTSTISFDQWVLSLDDISVAWFSLWLGITGEFVMDIVRELVLRMGIVVVNVALRDNCWLDGFVDDWSRLDDSFLEISWLMMNSNGWLMVDSDCWLVMIDSSRLNVLRLSVISDSWGWDDSSTGNCDDSSKCDELWKTDNVNIPVWWNFRTLLYLLWLPF